MVKRYHVGVRDFRDDVGVGKEVVGEGSGYTDEASVLFI